MEGKEELDMSVAMEDLVSSFIDMDGNSRVMFMKLLVTKMNDVEVDLILEVINDRYKAGDGDSNDDVLAVLSIEMEDDIVKKEPQQDENEEVECMDSFYLNYQEHSHESKNQNESIDFNQKPLLSELKLDPESEQRDKCSSKTVEDILEHVTKLTTVDKLILYQKLPNFQSNNNGLLYEPLPNSFGSSSEAIIWMKNHLQEDPRGTIPKQEVYDEFTVHCHTMSIKPLTTTDFGKVMKQVFPQVRKRRLGIRGKSRYCYAGIRKIMVTDGASGVPLHIGQDFKRLAGNVHFRQQMEPEGKRKLITDHLQEEIFDIFENVEHEFKVGEKRSKIDLDDRS